MPCTSKLWSLLKVIHQLLAAALLPMTLGDFIRNAPSIHAALRSNHPPSRPAALGVCLAFLREVVA